MSPTKQLRRAVGKRVKSITLNPFRAYPDAPGNRSNAYDPVIKFDDGSRLRFIVQETETGEYGVIPVYDPPPNDAARP